ncbi:YeeE/YedE thiosulfate transporter family protein [Vibrio sp. 99-70-13A1]|uniref:YeeE/YedE family protein n=1 Tax=Vibrio sp. 99-70-13A1 TaxID=2607601 RepID=UPI0014937185|nr:YeeE/YedE thiosulfate transporter family protein [Vibrio sp. 99-70-13A1]NOH96944.1 YeeE/YedE family protein [Vibrio sp. 99-70-13A1]
MSYSIPWHALAGGMLLGVSASILLLFIGRVAGISGIVSGLLKPVKGESSWRITFIVGMIASVFILLPFGVELPVVESSNLVLVAIAGLLVGFGTKISNGCTSGHGIVGLARFSKRSIVATLTFMAFAALTVLVTKVTGVM